MKEYLRLVLSALLLLGGILIDHTTTLFASVTVAALYYLVAFLPVGMGVVREAWEGIREGDVFNEFTLMTVAAIGAFAIGEYPEGVAVMLLYSLGEALQDGAVDRATRNISGLLDVRPDRATVLRDGTLTEADPAQVSVGEVIEVKPGGRVPLDGTLLPAEGSNGSGSSNGSNSSNSSERSGSSNSSECEADFDTSALTGESAPRSIAAGGDVLAGMIALGRPVHIRVTKPYEQSTLSRILSLVREAADRKAPAELFIRKFARIYTPVVILLALLIVAVPAIVVPLTGGEYLFKEWLYRGLVFLVISCPCALVISVPLGYYAGIGAASRLGILFKGGNYLDALTRVDTIAFDKTGTLTKGRFEVTDVRTADGIPASTLLSLARSLEAKSTHPIARAVVDYATAHGADELPLADLQELAGHGMRATWQGRPVLAGNSRLLAAEGIAVPEELSQSAATPVLCAIGGRYAGALLLADCLKPDAAATISGLRSLGITDVHLLSGDKQAVVDQYARELGIANAHAELLPEDKAARIARLVNDEHRTVAFVGDGMNDAPVLALSNVGIAMGGIGSDAAIESADVVIQNDMPSRVVTAIRIARTTKTIVRENIVGAIAIKVLVLALGALGYATLWAAVFADVGVALLAVANSMRVLYRRY